MEKFQEMFFLTIMILIVIISHTRHSSSLNSSCFQLIINWSHVIEQSQQEIKNENENIYLLHRDDGVWRKRVAKKINIFI